MDLRLALYDTVAALRLDATADRRLHRLAGFGREPEALASILPRIVAVLAAALAGLGLVFWIAVNWQGLGRFARFGLLEGLLLALGAVAIWRPAGRVPLGLLALLAIGGLFAYFGQTYQTGADAWILFAFWAALALPLCIGIRSDVVWAPWALVAATGISLWVYAHTGHSWRTRGFGDLRAYALGWVAAATLVAGLSAAFRPFTGAGPWALRTAVTLTTVMVTTSGIIDLFEVRSLAVYGSALVVLGAGAAALASRRGFDLYGLCVVALALDVLVVCGVARAVLQSSHGDAFISAVIVIGALAAAVVAATVTAVLWLGRRRGDAVAAAATTGTTA